MRIKEILYVFISTEAKNSIIAMSKNLSIPNQTKEYQLSYEQETEKFTRWSTEKIKADSAIQKLRSYIPEKELVKIIKEFEKMGQIIMEYGKTSLVGLNELLSPESDKYSHNSIVEKDSTSWFHVFNALIRKIEREKQKLKMEIWKSSIYFKIGNIGLNKHPLIEFLDELSSLLFVSTFPEKDTWPILKKIENF